MARLGPGFGGKPGPEKAGVQAKQALTASSSDGLLVLLSWEKYSDLSIPERMFTGVC